MAERKFTLYDCKAEGRPATNWYGEPLDGDTEFSKLQVGDAVRLVLEDPTGSGGWECIYFQISDISYYSKGQSRKPKTFRGIAMDTYRMGSEAYVKTGEEISFQRRNIIEIPSWKGTAEEIREIAKKKGKQAAIPRDQESAGTVKQYRKIEEKKRMLEAEAEWRRKHGQ